MAELFSDSGQSSDVAVSTPSLQGNYIPAIDKSVFTDGFGLSIPWGGGATTRKYSDYGISEATSVEDTQLNALSSMSFGGGGISYNLEGLVGPAGPAGPVGPQGLPGNFSGGAVGLLELDHTLEEISVLGTAIDQMIYTDTFTPIILDWGVVDLISGTTDGNTLPEPWPPLDPEERQISFGAGIELTKGKMYAIVCRAPYASDSADSALWSYKTSGGYSGGAKHYSTDEGLTWDDGSGDAGFQTKAGEVVKDSYIFAYTGSGFWIYGSAYWTAQTFIATSTYTITSVILNLYRASGATPGTIIVSIRAVDSYSEETWAETTITSFARTLIDDSTSAEARTTLGLGTGDSPTFTDLTLSAPSNIYSLSHDSFADFAANEHINHTGVTLTAGTGLTGGGDISANRTFAVDGVLEDLDTLGAATSDGQIIVATGVGVFAYESGATLRTSIGVDAAGTASGLVGTHAALTATHGVSGAIVGTTDNQALTTKTYNALTLAAAAVGFTVVGGTTPKTLTVDDAFVVSAQLAAIGLNTAKNTNVPTALSTGTVAATTYGITSDGGADDVVLAEATTTLAGLLGAAKWNEIVANTTHRGSNGSDHSIVGSNTTAIGLNTTHRGLVAGNPHVVTPAELGLVIGTDVQAYDASLTSIAGLGYVSPSFIKMTAEDTYAVRTIAETKSDLSLNLVENTALSTWVGSSNITTLGTIATVGNITIGNGGTIGQAAGPLLTFDDTLNKLSITGCSVGFGIAVPESILHLYGPQPEVILDNTTANALRSYFGTYNNGTRGVISLANNRQISTGVITDANRTAAYYNIETNNGESHHGWFVHATNNTNPTEKMRLTDAGKLAINNTNPTSYCDVTGDINCTDVYKVDDVQVVSNRGAAVANATGAGDVVAQLNALLARCRAHGLIAAS